MNSIYQPVYLEEKLQEIEADGRLGFRSKSLPTWCPGCGYFSVAEAVSKSLTQLRIAPHEAVVVSGIGCASRFPFFIRSYGFHTVHGRALPVATGIKVANEKLTVVVVGGDGDGFAIGGAHIPHTARRNVDITYLLFDNGIYGLTKGQTSPTSTLGFKTNSSPYDNRDLPLNPLMMLLSYGASWVGQSYAGTPHHLTEMVEEAITHRGFSYLHVISPCVTFDKTERTYHNMDVRVRELPDDYDNTNHTAAMEIARDVETPCLGVLYRESRPTLGDNMAATIEKAQGVQGLRQAS